MSSTSSIEWTDASWSPITGCSRVSEGCRNCYAEQLTATRLAHLPKYKGLAVIQNNDARWTNEIRCHDDELDVPLRWRKPRMIFVNSMSDTFHKDVPVEFIHKIMTTAAKCPQHTFQVLTKRPERASQVISRWLAEQDGRESPPGTVIPLANVWIGTSVENQDAADERIPHLLKCPAAIRFLSIEPMLEPVNLNEIHVDQEGMSLDYGQGPGPVKPVFRSAFSIHPWYGKVIPCDPGNGEQITKRLIQHFGGEQPIHWVIVGAESGPHRRECKLEWVRDLRDQCQAAGVAFFVKQLSINGKVEHDIEKFPEDLRIRQMPQRQVA